MAASRYANLQIQKPAKRQAEPEPKRTVGRPRGKASNPDYVATTLLLKSVNKRGLQFRAIEENRDMSDIVDSLIEDYLRTDSEASV